MLTPLSRWIAIEQAKQIITYNIYQYKNTAYASQSIMAQSFPKSTKISKYVAFIKRLKMLT
jgi:hypothetical protein